MKKLVSFDLVNSKRMHNTKCLFQTILREKEFCLCKDSLVSIIFPWCRSLWSSGGVPGMYASPTDQNFLSFMFLNVQFCKITGWNWYLWVQWPEIFTKIEIISVKIYWQLAHLCECYQLKLMREENLIDVKPRFNLMSF